MMADGSVKQRDAHRREQNKVVLIVVMTLSIIGTTVALFLASEPHDPTVITLGIAFAAAIIVVGLLYKPANQSALETKTCAHCNGLNHNHARYCQWCGFTLETSNLR